MDIIDKIPYMTVTFQNKLEPYEIPAFRGAVLQKVPPELTLFHNHVGDGFRYRYPLIQYKRIFGNAAIVCIGNGTEALAEYFQFPDLCFTIGERKELFTVGSITARPWLLQTWNTEFKYKILSWLPLNSPNYQKYNSLEGLIERSQMLESILTGNILSMSKGLGVNFSDQVKVKISDIISSRLISYKGVKMQAFDLTFLSNIYIPDHVGLGKGVSVGFGQVLYLTDKKANENNGQNEQ